MPAAIDIDRGVTIRQIVKFSSLHKFEPDPSWGGAFVYMYKDMPGVYLDVHGREVPLAVAEQAGFPVKQHAKQKALREAQRDFTEQMAKQLAIGDEELVVIAEAGSWKVMRLPMGRAKIIDKDTGENVNAVAMTEADALSFLEKLTGVKAEAARITAQTLKSKKPSTEDA